MNKLPTPSMSRIGFISQPAHTVRPDELINEVKTLFSDNNPINAVVVTQDSTPIGLVMNIHMNLMLSQRYGFSLFSQKPISSLMDKSPMMVNHDDRIEDVATRAMLRDDGHLYDHIIVLKNRRLHGIVAVRTILNVMVASQQERTDILERYAARLEREDLEKKEAIQKLKEAKKMFQLVIDTIPHAIFWKDCNSVYLGCNRQFAMDAGVTQPADIIGRTDDDLPWTDKEAILYKRQDQKIMLENSPGLDMHQVQTNARGEKRFLNTSKYPLHDSDRNVVGILCFYQDITQQLHNDNERIKLQQQLARSQKMEAIGRLAGGVAHDLNNILSGIVNYPELLMMDLPDDSKYIRPLKTIQESGLRAAAVVQDLLTLARRGVVKKEPMNINSMIHQYLMSPEALILAADYPRIKITVKTDPELMAIEGTPVHLTKTIMNLVNNSMEAIDGEGKISIKTWNQFLDHPLPGHPVVQHGTYACLSIADTGSGICREDLDKIFEPFYTTKKMGRSGTGLGMAVVWGAVKDMDGYIDIDSTSGKGTIVTLYLPARHKTAKVLPEKELSFSDLSGNGQTIWVVDDVLEQREIASLYLKKLNYQVQTFESGEQALNYFKRQRADLLVLDMIMEPGMDGLETFMKILEINPGQPAIITSGFSESDRVKRAQQLGAGTYLRKPYDFINLGAAVKQELLRAG